MKNAFLNNRNTHNLLEVLVSQPSRFFSSKELSVRTKISEGKLKIIIGTLVKSGLLNHLDKRKQRYYQINRRSNLLSEFGNLFVEKDKSSRRDFVERIISGCGDVKVAVLSGVFVGQLKSPVDLLLVGDFSESRLDKCVEGLERIVGDEVNYCVMTESEYKERLYSFDWFLKEIMERDPQVVVDKVSKTRVKAKGKHIAAVFLGNKQ